MRLNAQRCDYDPGRVSPHDLVAAVEAAGYAAHVPGATSAAPADDRLGLRVIVTAMLAIPVIAYSMASGLQTSGRDGWRWR